MAKVLVATATYNEAGNIQSLIHEIKKYTPEVDVLVIDDNSPDGTSKLIKDMMANDRSIQLIERPRKLGLGTAHKLMMKYAVTKGYECLITMDADFSHHPKYLPQFLEKLQTHDFVMGSRYAEGGQCDYGLIRMTISRTANILTRILLGIKLKECTTAYRGYRRSVLQKMDIDEIQAEGYSFFVEAVNNICKKTSSLVEIPIHFEDRRAGVTKISKHEIMRGVMTIFRLAFVRLLGLKSQIPPALPESEANNCKHCRSPYHVGMLVTPDMQLATANAGLGTTVSVDARTVKCLECGAVYRI